MSTSWCLCTRPALRLLAVSAISPRKASSAGWWPPRSSRSRRQGQGAMPCSAPASCVRGTSLERIETELQKRRFHPVVERLQALRWVQFIPVSYNGRASCPFGSPWPSAPTRSSGISVVLIAQDSS